MSLVQLFEGRVTRIEEVQRDFAWKLIHVLGYNLWASIHGKPELQIGEVYERDYSGEWPGAA